ncbi:MAG: oxidoreductase [Chlorobi bacterium]|nr:oxidoreductase [Chlorobiota bacterium]
MQWYTATFSRIEDVTDRHKRFWLTIEEVENFEFTPGQFITLELPIDEPKRPKRWRHYSIASPPNGNTIELIIVRVPGGKGTTYLFEEAKVGDRVPLRGPVGKFTLPEDISNVDICLIATGTGIAPFRSMIWHIYNKNIPHKKLYLIQGARNINELLYYQDFAELENKMENFQYLPVLSRETPPNWNGHKGYVHQVYKDMFKAGDNVLFYLCGLRNMIDEARKNLTDMGFDKTQIKFEAFD